jgi:hypothetical protein
MMNMETAVEIFLASLAALPGLYGFICWIRRVLNARRAARWVQATWPDEWNTLHWLAQRHAWAGIEVLVTKGLISASEIDAYRVRDEYLEKVSWLGLLVSAVLLLILAGAKYLVTVLG